MRTTLTIAVEGIDFDTQACVLRIKGRNVEENQYVKVKVIFSLSLFSLGLFKSMRFINEIMDQVTCID